MHRLDEKPVSSEAEKQSEKQARRRELAFEMLSQLQQSVRAIILNATVCNSSVRVSDPQTTQLFNDILRCFVQGCCRFPGADVSTHDVMFLLVVHEFTRTFYSDVHLVAYLCVNHLLVNFTRQLYADQLRMAHFYVQEAIMVDEELHLAFVSSLLALENVTFHTDIPFLAQQFLSASLDDIELIPMAKQRDRSISASSPEILEGALKSIHKAVTKDIKELTSHKDHQKLKGAAPDATVPTSDLNDFLEEGGRGLRSVPMVVDEGKKTEESHELKKAMATDDKTDDDGTDKATEVADVDSKADDDSAENTSEEVKDMSDQGQKSFLKPQMIPNSYSSEVQRPIALSLLQNSLEDDSGWSVLDDSGDEAAAQGSDLDEVIRAEPAPRKSTDSTSTKVSPQKASATSFGADVSDPFGLDSASKSTIDVPEIQVSAVGLTRNTSNSLLCKQKEESETLPTQAVEEMEQVDSEVNDTVGRLESLWGSSRKELSQRLMRQASGIVAPPTEAALGPKRQDGRTPSVSSTATPPGQTESPNGPQVFDIGRDDMDDLASECGAASECGSELSGGVSVSTPQPENLGVISPKPFGVHLRWKLRKTPSPAMSVQIVQQNGRCMECRKFLPVSLLTPPRYCHYLEGYFCTSCHKNDLRVIPTRAVEHWDFEPQKVCIAAAQFLDMHSGQPLIPINKIRRTKVPSQQMLTKVHYLRQQLMKCRSILKGCPSEFHKTLDVGLAEFEPHIVHSPELYALHDLMRLATPKPFLLTNLSSIVKQCVDHITSCEECSAAGQCCLICMSTQKIFAYEISIYYECTGCKSAFHRECFKRTRGECPKCVALDPMGKAKGRSCGVMSPYQPAIC